ncbi:MAG: hypothetical protein HY366_01805 [Candidatus Aenigmarchaeota archaeon]|nr:hypothetical protein [Candidatus Aenigmarchaeota archaeon]
MKRLLALLLLFALLPAAADARLEYVESNININATRTDFLMGIIFDRTPSGVLEYPLFYKIDNFVASASFKGASCEAQRKTWGTAIICDFTKSQGPGRTLELKYATADLVKLVDAQRHFSTTVRAPDDTDKMVVRAYLSQGLVLIDPEKGVLPPYTPVDGVSGSDGRRIFVVWTRNATARGDGLDVTLTYERILPQQNSESTLLIILGLTGAIIVIIAAVLLKRRKETFTQPLTLLKEDERRIVEFIQSQNGVARQRAIVAHTGFSKAKVSRLVRDLEARGAVTVRGMGRVNEVKLVVPKEAKAERPENEPVTPESKPETDKQNP